MVKYYHLASTNPWYLIPIDTTEPGFLPSSPTVNKSQKSTIPTKLLKYACTDLSRALLIRLSEDSVLKSPLGGQEVRCQDKYNITILTFSSPYLLTPSLILYQKALASLLYLPYAFVESIFKGPSQQMIRTRSRCPQSIVSNHGWVPPCKWTLLYATPNDQTLKKHSYTLDVLLVSIIQVLNSFDGERVPM